MNPFLVEYLAEVDETPLVPRDLRNHFVQLLQGLLEREIGPLVMLELPAASLAVGAGKYPAEGGGRHNGGGEQVEGDDDDEQIDSRRKIDKKETLFC